MPKLAWVLLPLMLYGLYLTGLLLVRRQAPARHVLNMHISLLLMLYLVATAGLGIFWVANQQLPVFDWHYLFGYGTVLLLAVHLYFNLPMVLRAMRTPHKRTAAPVAARGGKAGLTLALLAAILAYLLGASRPTTDAPAKLPLQGQSRPQAGVPPETPATAPQPSVATSASDDPGIDVVLRFHEVSSESRRAAFTRAPALDWGKAPADFKSYPSLPQIPLARGAAAQRGLSESLRGSGQPARQLRLPELGDLLHLSAGVTERRGGKALRAAPSSGALFSSELYVLAHSVQDLAPGVYHYNPDQHSLAALGPLPAASGAPSADSATATIVLTSIVRRTAYKYKNRAYRYMTADAGHLLENLRVASQSSGLQPALLRRFDEHQLSRTLGVDGVEEIVLAAMELRGGETPSLRAPAPSFLAAPLRTAAATGVTALVHDATSLRAPVAGEGGRNALPALSDTPAAVHKVIAGRRSQRRFTNDAVRLEVLASILADMNQPNQLSDAVRINLLVNRVKGLAPGLYRYERQHALRLVRSGDFAAAAESAALSQAVIGDAAVVLVLSVDRDAMLAEGARGYRHGFIETGLIGERWLLGAVARRLGACPVGAFYDDEAAALVGIDPQREWVLHFAALGVVANE